MKRRRNQHTTIAPAKVRKLCKARGITPYRLTQIMEADHGIKLFRLDKHGEGNGSATLDTVGALCKALKCKPNDVIKLVGGKQGVERA